MFRGACIGLAAIALAATPAHAYEFWLRADTIGQAYQLRDFYLIGPDVLLGRRMITQTLALRITDIGDLSLHRRTAHLPDRGLRISWQSYIRVDHDFGNYSTGSYLLPGPQVQGAIDVIPELSEQVAGLELMYGYLSLDGLLDDTLRFDVGRTLVDDGWGTGAIDGAVGRYDLPIPLEITASAGLRVRASSPLGVSAYELDGTSGAGCQEYVQGTTPGTGTWQLIDRNRTIQNLPYSSDYAYCPQRDVDQPSIGFTVALHGIKNVFVEGGYSRTWSNTPANIYPDEYNQAPSTGLDEERLYARAHVDLPLGPVTLEPYGDVRYSILNGLFDRADAGVRVRAGNSTLEPSVEYFYPTFDGDSIFNAFSIEPTTDVRLDYKYDAKGGWRATADAWLRKYAPEDASTSFAGGGDAAIERTFGTAWHAKLDALADGGYGGTRVGGTAEAGWKPYTVLWLRGRFIVLDVKEDAEASSPVNVLAGPPHYVTTSVNLSSSYKIAEWAALHVIAEADKDALYGLQTRVIGVLDLAFMPEP